MTEQVDHFGSGWERTKKRRRRQKRITLAAVAVVAAGALGFLVYILLPGPRPDECGSGVLRVDGECVGVTDGSYIFDPAFQQVEQLIKKENDWVVEESHRRGQRYVTIALLSPLTQGENGFLVGDKKLRLLQGTYIAQHRANRDPGVVGDPRPLIQLLLASEGSKQKQWKPVVDQLVDRIDDENPLVAVVGMGVSVDETEDAARALAEHDIPMVGAVLTADGLSQAGVPGKPGIPGLVRVSPTNVDYVAALKYYMDRHGLVGNPGKPRSAMMVYDNTATDQFVHDLRKNFEELLLKDGRLESLPPQSFGGQVSESQPAAFNNPVLNICNQRPDAILYAGREIDLKTFLDNLDNRSCANLHIQIATAATGFDTIRPRADELKQHNIEIVYASSVGVRRWGQEPAPADQPQHFGEYMKEFSDVFGSDLDSLGDGYAVMHHDAFLAAAQAVRAAELHLDSLGDGRTAAHIVRTQLLNLNSSLAIPGASGTICFSGHRNGDPENKPVPVLAIPEDQQKIDKDPYLTPHVQCTAPS